MRNKTCSLFDLNAHAEEWIYRAKNNRRPWAEKDKWAVDKYLTDEWSLFLERIAYEGLHLEPSSDKPNCLVLFRY